MIKFFRKLKAMFMVGTILTMSMAPSLTALKLVEERTKTAESVKDEIPATETLKKNGNNTTINL